MSFNLGNWAEKLECELCDGVDNSETGDFDDYDPDYDPGWFDDAPEPDDSDIFDDFPTGIPLGDNVEIYPTWSGGPGIGIRGWW